MKCADYSYYKNFKNSLIYCDPPYINTESYRNTPKFDHYEFYKWCENMSISNFVYVSERNAPDHWDLIWSKERKSTLHVNSSKTIVENLYKVIKK